MARYPRRPIPRYFRADAAFALPELYNDLEDEAFFDAIRTPANAVLRRKIDPLLTPARSGAPRRSPPSPLRHRTRPPRRLERERFPYST